MNRELETIVEQAAAWHAASFADDMDWDGFTLWLEADPRHRAAYDEVALADALVEDHRETLGSTLLPMAANDEDGEAVPRVSASWKRWAGVAIAASLVAVLALPQVLTPGAASYETAEASQTIALEDGSSVILAPHSSLTIEGRHQERMALSGGAWFDIRHDPDRSLSIDAGGLQISDIGTRFDIQSAGGQVRVEVGEGEVQVSSQMFSQPVRLVQGRGLTFDGAAGSSIVSAVRNEDIGEWRSGRLSYESAPLGLVVADLGRYAGVQVTVAPGLAGKRFSGTLVIGNGETALRDLSQLMGLGLAGGADGYRLDAAR